MSKNVKSQWTEIEQQAIEKIKNVVCWEVLLSYPDFSQCFHIHTYASHLQLDAVISQNHWPIAFYSHKLQPAQTWYTPTEWELLSTVETLKEFCNILLGQQIIVHMDHQNVTYKNFNSKHVMRWQLIIEEFGPTIQYMKGPKNIVADTLSPLDILPYEEALNMADCYGLDDEDLSSDSFPLTY